MTLLLTALVAKPGQSPYFVLDEIQIQNSEFNGILLRVKTDHQIINGLKPLTTGTKLNITKGSGLLPCTSFMFNLTLPGTGLKKFRLDHLAPTAYMLIQNDF